MAFWLPLHKGIPLLLLLWSHWLSRGFISLDMKYFLINWWVPWKLMKFIWTYTCSCLHLILTTTAIIYWAHVHLLTLWILTTTYEIGIIPISQITKLRQRVVKRLLQHHTASIFNGKFELRQFYSTSHIHHYTLFPDRSVLDGKLNINYLSYLLFFYFSCKDPFLTLHLLTLLIMLKIHCLKNAWYFISLILIYPDVLKQPKNQLFLIVQYLLNWL